MNMFKSYVFIVFVVFFDVFYSANGAPTIASVDTADANDWVKRNFGEPFFNNVYSPANNWFRGAWEKTKEFAKEKWGWAKEKLLTAINQMLEKFDEVFGDGSLENVKQKVNESYSKMKECNEKLKKFFREKFDGKFDGSHLEELKKIFQCAFKKSEDENQDKVSEAKKEELAIDLHDKLIRLRSSLIYTKKILEEDTN